jgi:phosphate acetyltransferase
MSKNVFIASSEPYSGKSVIVLGLVNMLLGKTKKLGYFKPIINDQPGGKKDNHLNTVTEYFGLATNYEDSFAFTRSAALQMMQKRSLGEMIDIIISKYKKLEEAYDFTVIEGSDFVGEGIAFEFQSNISIAKNLSAPAIIVISAENKTTAQAVTTALTVCNNYQASEVEVLAIVMNRVQA